MDRRVCACSACSAISVSPSVASIALAGRHVGCSSHIRVRVGGTFGANPVVRRSSLVKIETHFTHPITVVAGVLEGRAADGAVSILPQMKARSIGGRLTAIKVISSTQSLDRILSYLVLISASTAESKNTRKNAPRELIPIFICSNSQSVAIFFDYLCAVANYTSAKTELEVEPQGHSKFYAWNWMNPKRPKERSWRRSMMEQGARI